MLSRFFAFLKEYPLLGTLVCLLLSLYTGPKAFHEARYEGYLPLETISGEVIDGYTREGTGRRSRTHCYAKVKVESGIHDVQINCDDFANLEAGSSLELVKDGDDLESLSMNKGHFYIDLLLLISEIFGAIYYFRLSRRTSSKPIT